MKGIKCLNIYDKDFIIQSFPIWKQYQYQAINVKINKSTKIECYTMAENIFIITLKSPFKVFYEKKNIQ